MSAAKERTVQSSAHLEPQDLSILCGRDKSLTHRAVMFAALAKGQSEIKDPLLGADCLSTMDCFRALGVHIDASDRDTVHVDSAGFREFKQPTRELYCGNSGTTARLLTGLLAAQEGLRVTLTGDDSLSQRPMRRVVEPLRRMGAIILGRDDGNLMPLTIQGRKLEPWAHEVDKASAQIKSALLLAGLFCDGVSSINLPRGSRDHTERLLRKMGAKIECSEADGREQVLIEGPFTPKPGTFRIPVDPSSAAFFVVLGLLRKDACLTLPKVLDNPTRTGFLQILRRMTDGVRIETDDDSSFVEPVMAVHAFGGQKLRGTDIRAEEIPTLVDEIPILAVAAAFAEGPSRFYGLSELRVKESDRLSKTAELLRLAGADVRIEGDDLWIGGGLQEVQSFRYDSVGDHRLAMSAAIMARRSKNPCCVLDPECVGVSFPDFFESLEKVIG